MERELETFSPPMLEMAGVILVLACLYAAYRTTFSVDLTDEAQYVGQAYASLIGGKPFDSDLFLQQTVSVLLTPLVWIYAKVVGSSEGIVYFFRQLWWILATITAFTIDRRLKLILPRLHAVLIASLLVVFVPFNIPSPSYNSFGLLFLVLGLLSTSLLSLSQLTFLTLATICYPPFGVSIVGVFIGAGTYPTRRREVLRKFALVSLIGVVLGLAAGFGFGFDRLRDAFNFTSAFGTFGTAEKAALWRSQAAPMFEPLGWAFLGALTYLSFRPARAWMFGPLVLGVLALPFTELPHHYWTILLAASGIPLALRSPSGTLRSTALLGVLCGALSGWASSNGLVNATIGIFPAFVGSLVAWSLVAKSRIDRNLVTLALAVLVSAFVYENYRFVYRDQPISSLTTRVEWGPYQGLRTTPARAEFLDRIGRDVIRYGAGKSSVLFLYGFPAGYLMSTLRPATHMLYLHDREFSARIRAFLIPDPRDLPDLFVHLKAIPETYPFGPGDSILNQVYSANSGYSAIYDSPEYTFFEKVR